MPEAATTGGSAAAFRACERLDTERALLYLDLIGSSLNDIARAAFEDLMAINYEFQTDFAKKYSEKLVAAESAARSKGLADGRAEGRAEERAKSILAVLEARGIKIGAGQQQRVLACADLDTLDRWIRRAATVAKADELFHD